MIRTDAKEREIALRKSIAAALWRALDTEGLTQKELAELSEVPVSTISRTLYEKSTPKLSELVCIFKVLGMSLDEIVGLYDD